jgi:hypothetical protein
MPGVAIGYETNVGAGWSRLFQVLDDFPNDGFPQAAALVCRLDGNIHYLIEKAAVGSSVMAADIVLYRPATATAFALSAPRSLI